MQVTEKTSYTPEEYLALEETAEYKSEYIDGKIIPMAGGSTNHNQISINFTTELNVAFKRQDYRVYMVDVRLWIPKRRIYTYPDVMIVMGEPEYFDNRTDTITNPQVIIEVLSDSTQAYDREGKFQAYRTIPTFKEYLLINQTNIYVEQFSKTGNKRWTLREYDEEDEMISFDSLAFEISMQDLYNKVQLSTHENRDKG
ncbi:Uma2 family endonuclease [Calothrix rhizosoleniae]|uniref:Uma2 family endonuclease n=1 Tax=Calothrix rhizosoleniae TaxID=888997 RepID=UPI000B49E7FA|nr:Uma2 family endonuclease [Calothrix rhizosoleniae]